jgi:hypothetical protein
LLSDELIALVNTDKEKMKAVLVDSHIQVATDSTSETAGLPYADVVTAARLWFEALRASSGQPLLVDSVSPVNICPKTTFKAVLRDLESANLLFTYLQDGDRYVMFHDPRQLRTFEMLVPVPEVPQPDSFAMLANSVTMKEVLGMVAKEEDFTEQTRAQQLEVLQDLSLRTVKNVRVLNNEAIERLNFDPVVKEYLKRIISGSGPRA